MQPSNTATANPALARKTAWRARAIASMLGASCVNPPMSRRASAPAISVTGAVGVSPWAKDALVFPTGDQVRPPLLKAQTWGRTASAASGSGGSFASSSSATSAPATPPPPPSLAGVAAA